jgi:hypothetical protein
VWHIWIRAVLCNNNFFELLLGIDQELLEEAWRLPCPHCQGRLHRGDFRRKPRGAPASLAAEFATRFSLCCGRDGCRRRLTPFSVRFLARKVYVAAAVVLVAAAMQGPSPARLNRLCALFGMTRRTARRWLEWWRTSFADSDFFKTVRGLLRKAVEAPSLPRVLLELRRRPHAAGTTLAVLQLLEPITSSTAPSAQPV